MHKNEDTNLIESASNIVQQIGLGTWPDWIIATGTTAALLVAAFSYRHSVTLRREATARLVYTQVASLEAAAAGSTLRFREEVLLTWIDDGAVKYQDHPYKASYRAEKNMIIKSFRIANASAEVIGPLMVRPVDPNHNPGVTDAVILVDVIPPGDDILVGFAFDRNSSNDFKAINLALTFRDTGGNWWRRLSTSPIELLHKVPPEFRRIPHFSGSMKLRERLILLWKALNI